MANQQQIMEFVIKLYPDHLEDRDNVRIFIIYKKKPVSYFFLQRNFDEKSTRFAVVFFFVTYENTGKFLYTFDLSNLVL